MMRKLENDRFRLRHQQLALLVAVTIPPLDTGPVAFLRLEGFRWYESLDAED
jgi:hypothetical protein